MGFAKSFNHASQYIYRKLRASGKKYYLTKAARKNLQGNQINDVYKQKIQEFYRPYIKVNPVFHAVYKAYTEIEDVRFIPDDIFSNYIDRYYNISSKCVVLENKCYFSKMFSGVKQPKCIAMRMNGLWYIGDKLASYEDVKNNVIGHDAVIKQACGSGGGHDVHFLKSEDSIELFNRIIQRINEDIIIQEPIHQHPDLAKINPSSVNTVRVLSLLSKNGVKVYSCFLRCGRGGAKVDNASMGGLICGVDKTNGHLKDKAYSLKDYHEQYLKHPDTQTIFAQCIVPSWAKIMETVSIAAPQIPHSRMVAWDITVDEDGEPILIEANLNDSLVSAHQLVNGPIFKEDTEKILDEVFHRH